MSCLKVDFSLLEFIFFKLEHKYLFINGIAWKSMSIFQLQHAECSSALISIVPWLINAFFVLFVD
jgi:hypothetical protein